MARIGREERKAPTKITREELGTKLERGEGVILVEALPSRCYEEGYLTGAINIPHDRVDELMPKLLPIKTVGSVVYCSNRAC